MQKNPEVPPNSKWVKSENLHLTLKFFGEVGEENRPLLESALSKAAESGKTFAAEIQGIGAFPALRSARVLWAGVRDPAANLRALARSVEEETVRSGFPSSDKPFSEHLTLARFKAFPRANFIRLLEKDSEVSFGKMTVRCLCLIQSVLGSQGPAYQDLRQWSLR